MGNTDLISRSALEAKLNAFYDVKNGKLLSTDAIAALAAIDEAPNAVTGETSDGYHTFNELYHHRAVLFSVIVKAFPDKAWKSRQHSDGSMFDGMFIVGIDTPDGPATYHYDLDPYWYMFRCKEIERAPKWDGHTPAQAIERIRKLEPEEWNMQRGWWNIVEDGRGGELLECSNCRYPFRRLFPRSYCPSCGAMKDVKRPKYTDNDTAQYADNPTV